MRIGIISLALVVLVACGPPDDPVVPAPIPRPPPAAPLLHAAIDTYDFSSNPELLDRLIESPYGYFRFTNLQFANFVCERFDDAKESMPLVNLHGDAHLEQYAVTSLGRGLADYDDASTGPAVLDLVRFAASLRIVAKVRSWDALPAIDAFLEGYRATLHNPDVERAVPAYVTRIQQTFGDDRQVFLEQVESLMHPLEPDHRALFEAHFARYVKLMVGLHPELPEHFFVLKKYGRLRSGIGSALRKKFLMRIEGETSAPGDDVVLEAKELSDLRGIGCITASVGGGAFRILLGQTRVGGQPMRFLAQIPRAPGQALSEQPFWVQAWLDNYRELSLDDEKLTQADLVEVSRDVGFQLGRGHVMKIADPLGAQLRAAQLQMLDELEPRIRSTVDEMSALCFASWATFVREAQPAK